MWKHFKRNSILVGENDNAQNPLGDSSLINTER